jgi:hypothetical protein
MNLKEYFKQKLLEDLTTVELSNHMDNISREQSLRGTRSDFTDEQKEKMEASPHLYKLNKATGKPEKVEGVKMSRRLQKAVNAAVLHDDPSPITAEHRRTLRSFVAKHGDLMGRTTSLTEPAEHINSYGSYSTDPGLDDSGVISHALGYRPSSIEKRRDMS